ncbi:integrase [Acutalibacter muris]|uniref:integrase n=1 Tax=Acutalibacter muris TaxID=1796620 RepID=UPI001C3EEDD0|nr:integrase [Acutalibacter muris]
MTVTDISREPQKPEIIRFAAYCRVSSKSADQLHSFAAQIRYYKDYERKNPQYKLVDVYADGSVKIGLNQEHPNSKGAPV